MLEVRNISKRFGGFQVLKDCSLEAAKGRVTGIIGPNGAGKSTLFSVISGFITPDAGQVIFDGRPVNRVPPHLLARMGLVRTFQVPREFGQMTVLENLLVAAPDQRGERLVDVWFRWGSVLAQEEELHRQAREVLAFLRLQALEKHPAGQLSGGQKKLLELGRALMLNPRVLLLDEPFAGVNEGLARELEQHIRTLSQSGITVLLIEHNMPAVMALCDYVYVMAEGSVLTSGPPDIIQRDERVLEAYLGAIPQ